MRTVLALFIYMDALLGIAGCKSKGHSTDPEENKYYSIYRNIYHSYEKVPVDTTLKQLESYLSKYPENGDAWSLYGNACFKTKDYEKAKAAYWRAIETGKSKGLYYSSLGTMYGAQNKLDSAEKYLTKGVELKDSSGFTLLNLAMLYKHKNEPALATKFADAAATSAKKDSSYLVCAGLSYVYAGLGDAQKSAAMAETARQLGLKDTTGLKNILNGTLSIDDFYATNY